MRGLNKESQDVRDQLTMMEHSLNELKREKQDAEDNYRSIHDELNSKQRFINELQKKIKFKDDILKNHLDMQTTSPVKDEDIQTPSRRNSRASKRGFGSHSSGSLGGSSINKDLKFEDDHDIFSQRGDPTETRRKSKGRRSTTKKRKLTKKNSILPGVSVADEEPT